MKTGLGSFVAFLGIVTAAIPFACLAVVCAEEPAGTRLKTPHGDVAVFPADNPWNTDISQAPVDRLSAEYLASMGLDAPLHPDFGAVWQGAPSGIPYVVVGPNQPRVNVAFEYADESDPGPYPIPLNAPIEGGPKSTGDRHVLVIDPQGKRLYELFNAFPEKDGWRASSGAVFDLSSNARRPAGWTSADAAGLPIFPGLVRYEEVVEQGRVTHALRFTVKKTQRAYAAPATHFASRDVDEKRPPMGLRLRLRADYPLDRFPREAKVILQGLKNYGMLLADNGGDLYVSGAPHPRWDDEALATLKRVRTRDFECVETGPLTTR